MTTSTAPRRTTRTARDGTPDSHGFATRPYDLVKEFVVALVVDDVRDAIVERHRLLRPTGLRR